MSASMSSISGMGAPDSSSSGDIGLPSIQAGTSTRGVPFCGRGSDGISSSTAPWSGSVDSVVEAGSGLRLRPSAAVAPRAEVSKNHSRSSLPSGSSNFPSEASWFFSSASEDMVCCRSQRERERKGGTFVRESSARGPVVTCEDRTRSLIRWTLPYHGGAATARKGDQPQLPSDRLLWPGHPQQPNVGPAREGWLGGVAREGEEGWSKPCNANPLLHTNIVR